MTRRRLRTRFLHQLRSERGQALVEFALLAPVLFVVLFAVLDFGKAMNYWNDETHLAATGARYAVVNTGVPGTCPDGSTPGTLQAYIKCQADTAQLRQSATVCISAPHSPPQVNDPVTVTIKQRYTFLPLIGTFIGQSGSFTLRGSATMRNEADLVNTTPNYSLGSGGTGSCP
jgi:TadE-like protein